MKVFSILFSVIFFSKSLQAQHIKVLSSRDNISLRGLSVARANVLWASGSNGAVVRSLDGGKTFEWLKVAGYEKRDFRDIEAFDENNIVIMAVDEPAVILKTNDAGKTWRKVFEDSTKGMFLDAMDFEGENGVVVGDPINSKPFIAFTKDKGEHWDVDKSVTDTLKTGEAFFAASGTNVKLLRSDTGSFIYVTGGMDSRFYYQNKLYKLPVVKGNESSGANSVAVDAGAKCAIVVGGDFKNEGSSSLNCVLIKLNDILNFSYPATPPTGYKSCVIYLSKDTLVTCGTSGVDVSFDRGKNWRMISKESFHVCQKAKNGKIVFLAGANGQIAKLEW